jgi:hypothetical protein
LGNQEVKTSGTASGPALDFGPLSGLRLDGDDPAVVAWAREYFGPALCERPEDEAEVEVRIAHGARDELLEGRPDEARPHPFFVFDQRLHELPCWAGLEGTVGLDEPRSSLVEVLPDGATVAGDFEARRWRFTLALVIKELLASRMRHDQLEMHAAAVESKGRAIVFAGPKGAGKTTLSCHLMRAGGCASIANDRVFLSLVDGVASALGMPSALKVKPGTDAEFPELRSGLPDIPRPYLYTQAELRDLPATAPSHSEELMVGPEQLADLLGATRLGSAPLGALVFPHVDPGAEGIAIEQLSPEEARVRILDSRFGDPARRRATVFEEVNGHPLPPPGNALAPAMAEAVPSFDAVLGRGAYDDSGFAEALLEELGC